MGLISASILFVGFVPNFVIIVSLIVALILGVGWDKDGPMILTECVDNKRN